MATILHYTLLHKDQIYGADNEQKRQYMVPMEVLSLEQNVGYHGKDAKTDALLYDLKLYKTERAAIPLKAYTVGGHLTTILEKGYAP